MPQARNSFAHSGLSLFDLFFPSNCLLCHAPPKLLCPACQSRVIGEPGAVRRVHDGRAIRGFRASELNPGLAKLLAAIKDHHRVALVEQLAPAFIADLEAWLGDGSVILVPMPTSKASWRKRGFNLPKLLAALFRRESTLVAEICDCLAYVRIVGDQRALNTSERAQNLSGSMIATAQPLEALIARFQAAGQKPRILLIDDVITTGATMAEASRALAAEGIHIDGFAVFAETLLKTPTHSPKWV